MAAVSWHLEVDASFRRVGLEGSAVRAPALVLTDKAELPTFLLLCRHCTPGVTCEVVPKMKAHMHN